MDCSFVCSVCFVCFVVSFFLLDFCLLGCLMLFFCFFVLCLLFVCFKCFFIFFFFILSFGWLVRWFVCLFVCVFVLPSQSKGGSPTPMGPTGIYQADVHPYHKWHRLPWQSIACLSKRFLSKVDVRGQHFGDFRTKATARGERGDGCPLGLGRCTELPPGNVWLML